MGNDEKVGELKLPPGSTVKLTKDGQPVLEMKGDRKASKEARQEEQEKELLTAWSAVAGQPEVLKHIFIYKRLEGTDGYGNNEALTMTLPLTQFIDEGGNILLDLEEWLKERVEKGTYVCRIKVNNRIAKNIPNYTYTFVEDGRIWRKEKLDEDDEGEGSGLRNKFRGRERGASTREIASAVEGAVRLGIEAKAGEVEERGSIVRDLTSVIIEKDKNKQPDTTMPLLLEVIKSAINPRTDNSQTEAIRIVMESVKDLGKNMSDSVRELSKMIGDMNQENYKMQIQAIEERHKDKIEIMKLMQENKGGSDAENINKMIKPVFETFSVMSGVQAQAMEGVMKMVKGAVELATDLKRLGGEELEEKETLGEKIVDSVLEVGSKVVDGLLSRKQENISFQSGSSQEEEFKNSERKREEEKIMGEDGQFLNEIVNKMLEGINNKFVNDKIIGDIFILYADKKDKIKELMSKEQSEIEQLLTLANKGKIISNFGRMKELMEKFKEEFLKEEEI